MTVRLELDARLAAGVDFHHALGQHHASLPGLGRRGVPGRIRAPGCSWLARPLATAITADLGGFAAFKEAFTKAATTRFGSGWAWLSVDKNKKLIVESTPNQDSPLMHGHVPILGCDVWEHAYYLKYQNKRPDYVAAFFNVINWNAVAERYATAKK